MTKFWSGGWVGPDNGVTLVSLLTGKGAMFAASAAGVASETHQQSEGQVPVSAPNDPNGIIWSAPSVVKRLQALLANPTAATGTQIGFAGSASLTATAANGDDQDGPWVQHTTTAVANNVSGVTPSSQWVTRGGWLPDLEITTQAGVTLTNVRYLIGLFSASPDTVPTPTTLHGAWFRYDTSVDGTAFWRCCTAAGGSPTVTTTTTAITASTYYKLRIEFVGVRGSNPTSVRFLINDVVVATHILTLPIATQAMSPYWRITTLAAATKAAKWGKIALATV